MSVRCVLAFLLCLALIPCAVWAASVEGQVIGQQTKQPVCYTRITIGGRTTKTDGGGYFVLWVNPGTQHIRVQGRECSPSQLRVDPQRRNRVRIECR